MRPERTFLAAAGRAVRKGCRAATSNFASIFAIQLAMGAIVAAYYFWPAGSAALVAYAKWVSAGGGFANGLVLALSGGVLSEVSYVCFQKKGHWTRANVESLAFKFVIFYVGGFIVYYFYCMQAVWWGSAATLPIIIHKVLFDQFGYTVVFAAPYYALMTRWHALRYSGARLWHEIKGDFVTERLLPVLVTNWMFWIPTVSFVYALPTALQPPVAAFATAIWGILVSALGHQEPEHPGKSVPVAAGPAASPPMVAEPVE